ncbi:MAG TPA: 1,4-dihydroxy-2-naphthoate octaprenyltransferase [Candidatus Kapabacteria bacterium]|nr:1,4-dihydroxy-2-naphthoate octaprenyltransferase [Candidatus Kapabacteria bacterium]
MSSLKTYWVATRPFAFTASVIPTVMGGVIALAMYSNNPDFHFNIINFLLTIVGCMAVQSSCNLINDFYDYKTGLDTAENFGAMNVLVRGSLSPKQVINEAVVTMIGALAIGAFLLIAAGPAVLWFVLFGFLSAIFYTAPPLNLKYRGFGDIQVIVSFGAIMTLGAYFVQAHNVMDLSWSSAEVWKVVLYSLPSGLLIDAILHANNHRDLYSDKERGIKTMAIMLGEKPSQALQYVLVVGAYLFIVAMVALRYMTPFALLTLATLPKALVVLKKIGGRNTIDAGAFNMMVIDAAQLHTAFGAAMIVGFVVSYFVKF